MTTTDTTDSAYWYLKRIHADELLAMYDRLDEACDTFQWGPAEALKGEVHLDREANMLRLDVYVLDTDEEDPEETKGLTFSREVDPYIEPREQIRALIHWHLVHEADEQMWWIENIPERGWQMDRPFYPHNEDGSLRDA